MLSEVVKLIVKTMVLNRLTKHRGTISFEVIEFFFFSFMEQNFERVTREVWEKRWGEKCTPRSFSFLEQRESRREFSFALLIQQWFFFFFFSSILSVWVSTMAKIVS